MYKVIHAHDIKWDTDGESPASLGLPDKVDIPFSEVEAFCQGDVPREIKVFHDLVGDFLSERYGFCHFGFAYDTSS